MKLAITGGVGFLGYHLCNRLSDKYEEILVLDITSIDKSEYPKNIKYFNVDVRNQNQLDEIFKEKEVDVIIHAAAALPLWKKRNIFDTNIKGTKNILKVAQNNNVQKVVFISSTAVYGVPKKHPIFEDDPLVGVGAYGESKIEAEAICRQYREKGMCVPIMRPKTFVGTGRLGVFQILHEWVEEGRKIPIIGNGKNRYQLLEVDDLVDAIYLILIESADKCNQTFNVGAEKFNTVLEDVGALCDFAKTGARVLPTPVKMVKLLLALFEKMEISPLYKWIYDTADTDSFVSTDKIKNTFNWSPKYSNVQALIRSYEWYLKHKNEFSKTGLTHRTVWKQGILKLVKALL